MESSSRFGNQKSIGGRFYLVWPKTGYLEFVKKEVFWALTEKGREAAPLSPKENVGNRSRKVTQNPVKKTTGVRKEIGDSGQN